LSHRALKAAIMIMLYRDVPIFQMPSELLANILDLDNLLTQWRNRHALMVHRMLGSKMGTGGSSGFHYLRATLSFHKVFADFFNLSSYMIPKSYTPKLPRDIELLMMFPKAIQFMRNVQQARHRDAQDPNANNVVQESKEEDELEESEKCALGKHRWSKDSHSEMTFPVLTKSASSMVISSQGKLHPSKKGGAEGGDKERKFQRTGVSSKAPALEPVKKDPEPEE